MGDFVWLIEENVPAELLSRHAFYSIVQVQVKRGVYEIMEVENDNINFGADLDDD